MNNIPVQAFDPAEKSFYPALLHMDGDRFIGLERSAQEWAEAVLESKGADDRSHAQDDIANSHYDIRTAHAILEKFYFHLLARGEE